MKQMKVLSLFDGISCGMVALERAGIPVDRMKHLSGPMQESSKLLLKSRTMCSMRSTKNI